MTKITIIGAGSAGFATELMSDFLLPPALQTGAFALADNSCNPSEQALKAEQAEQVRRAIQLLPKRQRATLVLAYYQQLSYPDVAEVMGCSVGTVKTQMFRALKTLANKLPEI